MQKLNALRPGEKAFFAERRRLGLEVGLYEDGKVIMQELLNTGAAKGK